jgi:hypothetical protein
MGYKHYWRGDESNIDNGDWEKAILDCDTIIAKHKVTYELDVNTDATMDIFFNGNPDRNHDHETFVMPREVDDVRSKGFGFCKTAAKPYDVVVTACLARMAEAGLKVSSDGGPENWRDGLDAAREALGREVQNPIQ